MVSFVFISTGFHCKWSNHHFDKHQACEGSCQRKVFEGLNKVFYCPEYSAFWYAGSDARLVSVSNKAHAMIGGEEEMRAVMTFWAKHLKSGAPEALQGETIVEVEPGSASLKG